MKSTTKPVMTGKEKTSKKINANSPHRSRLYNDQSKFLRLERAIGNRAIGQLIQAKLTIGSPNDKYEQEADRVADEVMRMPDPRLQRQPENEEEGETFQTKPLAEQITPLVQRQEKFPEQEEPVQTEFKDGEMLQRVCPECEEEQSLQRQHEEEEEEELQAKERPDQTPEVTPDLESRIASLHGGGQPLSPSSRAFFEPHFGQNFSHVRIHSGTCAADIARAVNARAFTLGRDVVFGAGQYQPDSTDGMRLLAHELTHTLQQGKKRNYSSYIQRISDSKPLSLLNIPKPVIRKTSSGLFVTVYFGQNQFLPIGDNFNAVLFLLQHIEDILPPIKVDAHASTEGGPEYNWELSKKRRNTVIDILTPLIPSELKFSGYPWGDYLSQVRDIGMSKEERTSKMLRDRRVEIFGVWKPSSMKKLLAVPESVVEKPPEKPAEEVDFNKKLMRFKDVKSFKGPTLMEMLEQTEIVKFFNKTRKYFIAFVDKMTEKLGLPENIRDAIREAIPDFRELTHMAIDKAVENIPDKAKREAARATLRTLLELRP